MKAWLDIKGQLRARVETEEQRIMRETESRVAELKRQCDEEVARVRQEGGWRMRGV